ncbi:bifunctional adenosylcobinamide kinase/adenosylcobinamide-phosphate guanylyltransferase [Subdoligranulum variabile]|uniref:Uncharacterized protein n=1 Tax=Subdoligranulum variabile DSM 15176 TaxID=411471 RepID=D1PMC0_9FIRM|nr:bifunctional adenosylcobinamide kinase/adenosylcobinamide-phosphate guanylyltransferase [Subdoligranulum variabile]EFB75705.1 hypothetical protein SUBVAR_05480 [Subdoligranulum variabile DSM 15176]UWP68406.1 bifunctional adenosylcobinamide kinase/adenosylcobinamide-phosphate guanylyltransferase [Subdoligranulum variabile]
MIFLFGPLYSGKRAFACRILHCTEEELDGHAVVNAQQLAAQAQDLTALADELAQNEIVIATEVGGGIVPVDSDARAAREAAGRFNCLLAARADIVVRVFYGLPLVLKGSLEL